MNNKPTFYKSSEDLQPRPLFMGISLGLAVSLVLGYFYYLFSTFIPFIYFNVLVIIGLGLGIGLAARLISKVSHLKNRKGRLLLVISMALFTFLFQWIAYLASLERGFMLGILEYLNSIPQFLGGAYFSLIPDLYNNGSWSIGSFLFNKSLLALVWLMELCIIITLPVLGVMKTIEFPYSEKYDRWYPKFTLSDQFESMSTKRYFLVDYYNDLPTGIHNLKMGEGWRYGKVHIYFIEGESKQYLSFEKILYNERGKGKKTSTHLIENLEISRQDAKSILAAFPNEKEKFDVF